MKELKTEALIANVTSVTEFIDAELESMDCPMKAQMQIDIAVDELFSNIARYAYGEAEDKPVAIQLEETSDPHGVVITFIDEGVPYDPLAKDDPDVTGSAEERSIGGLGIFIVKKSMDDMYYVHQDGKNMLSIRKNF